MKKNKKMFAAVLVMSVMGMMMLGGCASSSDRPITLKYDDSSEKTISVSASSEIKVTPDKAKIIFLVKSEGDTPKECQDENTLKTNAVVDALKNMGIDETGITTSNISLEPVYDNGYSIYDYSVNESEKSAGAAKDTDEEVTAETEIAVEEETDSATDIPEDNISDSLDDSAYDIYKYYPYTDQYRIIGYNMSTDIEVEGIGVDAVGDVINSAVEAGANGITESSFYSSEYDAKYAQALAEAIKLAKAKADAMAIAGNFTIASVNTVSEGYENTSARYVQAASMADSHSSGASFKESDTAKAAMTTMPGQLTITAQVNINYNIENKPEAK